MKRIMCHLFSLFGQRAPRSSVTDRWRATAPGVKVSDRIRAALNIFLQTKMIRNQRFVDSEWMAI